MITVHLLNLSRAERLIWLLEELELPYEIKHYKRTAAYLAPKELKAVHPLGKSPVIEDDGKVIAESGAIFEYILEKYGNGRLVPPAGSDEKLRYTYFMHYTEGSAMPLLVMKLIFMKIPDRVPFLIKPIAKLISKGATDSLIDPQLRDHIAFWESELSRDGWFAGKDFTAADIMMSFPLENIGVRFPQARESRAIQAYLDAIAARPAYKRAKEKA
ncbi:glutathione S-transferase [Rhizobium sp. L1K21]|uniref:glutathione S-transferase n=1 Tax=Rhizobium sp. L1K21 TaxID=2954933 RepID=UPI002093405B|nr:glutathione S-transferase [Rhizobium sp. L1K21]MCO6185509.1 glutathione S-transferase [Rhizobium sp. L1K21]